MATMTKGRTRMRKCADCGRKFHVPKTAENALHFAMFRPTHNLIGKACPSSGGAPTHATRRPRR